MFRFSENAVLYISLSNMWNAEIGKQFKATNPGNVAENFQNDPACDSFRTASSHQKVKQTGA